MTPVVAFVGLGDIGAPIAGRLAAADYRLLVSNRSPAKQEAWLKEYAGGPLGSLRDLATVDVIITCVADDDDLRALYWGDSGLIAHLPQNALVIDHTTASAVVARELHEAVASAGAQFLDAPVSGGSAGARNGALSVMIGGQAAAVARAEPILAHYSRTAKHVGGPGAGQLCKMVNQLCIAGVLQGLAEGLALARAAELDTDRVLGAISSGAAASWQMENRSSFMLSDAYVAGFAARLMHKDLGLCSEEALRLGLSLPGASLVVQEYAELMSQGLGSEDFSNLHRLVRGSAGV